MRLYKLDQCSQKMYNISKMLSINDIKKAVAKIGKKYGIKNAYLFGSYARGEANEYSDVDLMIDGGQIHGLYELSGFRLDMMDELGGVDVNVVTAKGMKPKFFNVIKNDRIPLYGC